MFRRQIDVVLIQPSGKSIVLVNHNDYPNTFMCSGNFNRYSGTQSDKLTITIYNLPAAVRGDIALGKYSTIIVKYGYEDESDMPNDLFIGNIVRRFNSGPDETSDSTTIIALDTGSFSALDFFSGSYADDANYYRIADDLLREARINGNISSYEISNKLKEYKTGAEKAYFAASDDVLDEISQENNLVYKKTNNSILLLTPQEIITQSTATEFSVFDDSTGKVESRSGLIGLPELTDSGLRLQCLVNCKLSVHSLVRINNSIINIERTGEVSEAEFGAALDPDGLYVITAISGNFSNDGSNNSMTVSCYARHIYFDMYNQTEEDDE